MRTQYCREHLTPKVADECGIPKRMYSENQRATEFCRTHLLFSAFSTDAILSLIDHSDEKVKETAIFTVEKSLDLDKHPLTGKFLKQKRLSKVEVEKVIEKAELEVHGTISKKIRKEKKTPFNGTPQKDDFKDTEPVPEPKTLAQSVGFTVRSEPVTVKQPSTTQAPPSIPPTPAPVSSDPIKQKRFMMDWHAEECVKLMSPTVQTMVMDILRENRSWKTADAIYFGIQALAEQKKKR